MVMTVTGFHGTSLDKCRSILGCNYFRWSTEDDNWLGDGIYFFERQWYAIWWATEYKRYRQYAVLQATITAEETRILDLTSPEQINELDEIATALCSGSHRGRTDITDGMLINYIYRNIRKFDLVKAIFDDTQTRRSSIPYYPSRIRPHQTQICVRATDCINNIQQVS
jgi:hypothetical protein